MLFIYKQTEKNSEYRLYSIGIRCLVYQYFYLPLYCIGDDGGDEPLSLTATT